ncbi:MAG TPA: 30S ribosomal protein S20 [Candidatus Paceibacterota bacterium]|nr:30S ribosomal protein S20 [Candidatus Paceibacterota bacterium]
MPITSSAKRAVRGSSKKRKANSQKKIVLKKTKKEFLKLIDGGKIEEAKKMLPKAYELLDKAAKVNLIKKNRASREKSRLAKKAFKK